MKLPKRPSKPKIPVSAKVALGVLTGFAAGTGVVLKGREAVEQAAAMVGSWAERRGGGG